MGDRRSGIGGGVLLITIGSIFLADQAGYGGFHNWWPLILIVSGASRILFPRDRAFRAGVVAGRRGCRPHPFSGLWLILVGGIFLLHQNHIFTIHQLWPLFIVAAGVGIMFSGAFNRRDVDPNPGGPMAGGGGQ